MKAMIASCVAASIIVSLWGTAAAEVAVFKRVSGWEAFGGRAEDGSRVCGVSTSGGGRFFSMKYFEGHSHLTIHLSKDTWKVAAGRAIDVSLHFDSRDPWKARATSFHLANGDAALQFSIQNDNVKQWIKEFRDADVLYIRFPASVVDDWRADLSGTPEIADAMVQCLSVMIRMAPQT